MIKYGAEILQVPTPEEGRVIYWVIGVLAAAVAFLYVAWRKDTKDFEKRYDELNKRLLDDKDKAIEQYIEQTQKTLTTINTLVDSINDIPKEVVKESMLQCKANLESVLKDK